MLAPTAFNLQNVKLIAVTSKEKKEALCETAFQQQKIKNAAATFIICGDEEGYKDLARLLKPSVETAGMPQDRADGWIKMATRMHTDNVELRRDEAFRSGSLVSMTLMLAAEDLGYATGAIQKTFNLGDRIVPVMLVTVGKPTEKRYPQKVRRPLFEVLRTE